MLFTVQNTLLPRSVDILSNQDVAAQAFSQSEILTLAHYLDDCFLLVFLLTQYLLQFLIVLIEKLSDAISQVRPQVPHLIQDGTQFVKGHLA